MREAQRVGADLADEGHVLAVLLLREGIAEGLAVLVAAHAAQRIAAAVEEEAALGVVGEAAHAKARGDLVHHGAGDDELAAGGVEVRVVEAVPAVRVREVDGDVGAGRRAHRGARGVGEGHADHGGGCVGPVHPGLDANPRVLLAIGDLGRDGDPGTAVVVEREVRGVGHEELHVAVDAAVEGEVGLLGVDAVVLGVVDGDPERVRARLDEVRDVDAEGRVAAVVMAAGDAVDLDVGGGVDALELEVDNLAGRVERGDLERALVDAGPAPVVVAAILTVEVVPRVRDVHRNRGVPGLGEGPALVEVRVRAHAPSFLGSPPLQYGTFN